MFKAQIVEAKLRIQKNLKTCQQYQEDIEKLNSKINYYEIMLDDLVQQHTHYSVLKPTTADEIKVKYDLISEMVVQLKNCVSKQMKAIKSMQKESDLCGEKISSLDLLLHVYTKKPTREVTSAFMMN